MSVREPTDYGYFNARGFYTLYFKEVSRFMAVWQQTLAGPAASSLLFLLVFTVAIPRSVAGTGDISYSQFLAPGLIIMAMIQNSFANTSSSIIVGKIQKNLTDVLLPPISSFEFTLAYTLGGVTRGLLVGCSTGIILALFISLPLTNVLYVLFFGITASIILALLGVIAGLWAEKFDHIASVTNFIIMPLTFLSGTFYSIERLPDFFNGFARLNPVFYAIDGFRSGFIGTAESSRLAGIFLMLTLIAILGFLAWRLVDRGYKIKS